MQILYVELHASGNHTADRAVELRYRNLNGKGYESQILALHEIADLIAGAERDFYQERDLADPVAMGQKLYAWLDGTGRWLSRAIADCREEVLGMAIADFTDAKLLHLPWEVLHDRTGYLIDRMHPKFLPVRWVAGAVDQVQPAERPLRVMFMATDPEDVEPRLDFEREEGRILG